LYVGFMSGGPIHGNASLRVELGKIDRDAEKGQRDPLNGVTLRPLHTGPRAV